ncbi:MAG: MerR family transcriptional regulator [Acidimicrobiales bacterium]
MTTLSIAEAAESAGVSAHTLRYYERIGLLEPVERDGGGRRSYSDDDLARVTFLTKMRATGMPIRDLQRYVELVRSGQHTSGERRALLEAHRERIRDQLAYLETCLEMLDLKIDLYRCWESS